MARTPTPRICLIGFGRWGRNHARALHEMGALAGICDESMAARLLASSLYPALIQRGLDSALAHDYDGYVIATPASTHYELAIRIISAGKPLLVEKPLALSVNEAVAINEAAKTMGVPLMVGHTMLFHPAIRRIKTMIDAGDLGELQYLYSNRLNLGTIRTEENILWSFAPHDISIFQHLIGRTPERVISHGAAIVRPEIHDTTMTVLHYPGNITGHIFVSWLHPFKEHRLVVIGSRGMLSWEDARGTAIRFYRRGSTAMLEPLGDVPVELVGYDCARPLTEELRAFLRAVAGDPVTLANGDSAVEVLEILERASADISPALVG